jgi:hypothetical protein
VDRPWPTRLTISTPAEGQTTTMVHIDPPQEDAPLDMDFLRNLIAETAEDETLAEAPFKYKLQYKLSYMAAKEPWIKLDTDRDAFICQETVVKYLLRKRKATGWSLNIEMVPEGKKRPGGADMEGSENASKGKKRKVSLINPTVKIKLLKKYLDKVCSRAGRRKRR